MDASDTPAALPAPADGAPAPDPPTMEDMVAEMALERYEVGAALWEEYQDADWTEMLDVLAPANNAGQETDAATKTRMGILADSMQRKTLLVVDGGKVRTIYGWKTCRELNAGGGRWVALVGERRRSPSGLELHPKMVQVSPNHLGNQVRAFQAKQGAAPAVQDIETHFQNDADAVMIDALGPGAGGAAAAEITMWRALPVHPKMAVAFMRGIPVRQAFEWAVKVYHAAPEASRPRLKALMRFMRLAVTQEQVGGQATSMLETQWSVVAISNDELEQFYLSMLDILAPRTPDPVPPPASTPPLADDLGSSSGGRDSAQSREDRIVASIDSALGSGSRRFTRSEVNLLLWHQNVPGGTNLTMASSNLFWRGAEDERKSTKRMRRHVETYMQDNYPADRFLYPFVLMTRLITDLADLNFNGGDIGCQWTQRHKGLSIFALAPLADGEDAGPLKDECVAYENTQENHRPKDRDDMEKLQVPTYAVPANRDQFYRYVDFFEIMMIILFGEQCRLVTAFEELRTVLRQATKIRNHGKEEWNVYWWKLHEATRDYWGRNRSLTAFERLVNDMSNGTIINSKEVPKEVFGKQDTPTPTGTGGPRDKRGGKEDAEANKRQRTDRPEWASRFAPLITRAKSALEGVNQNFTIRKMLPGKDGIRDLLGNQFCRLLIGHGGPCAQKFIMGECRNNRCNFCHALKEPPSDAIVRGIVDRLEKRVKAIEADPSKA